MTQECLSSMIFHGLCCEFGAGPLDSEPYRSPAVGHCFHPCGHFAVCRSAALTSVHCAHVSELLEQPVNATCRPSFLRKILSSTVSHYVPSTDIIFSERAIARPSVCRLSVVCNARAPYSGG